MLQVRPYFCVHFIQQQSTMYHSSPPFMYKYLHFLLLILMINTSCAALRNKKWLTTHQTYLMSLAQDKNASAEQKLDGLFSTYVVLMEQGLKFGNPVKGAKYIKQFQEQNQSSIQTILGDAEKWRSGLNIAQGLELGLSIPRKPYAKDFITLLPKFRRKYNQYKFVADLTGSIAGGFGKTAGKIFGL
jgi:hypothetical protein